MFGILWVSPSPFSSRTANNTERIMRYWRYSRIKRIRITSVRLSHHFVSRVALNLMIRLKKKKEQKVALPELSQTQITKLKHLSLLSYAMQQRVNPSYPFLSLFLILTSETNRSSLTPICKRV